MINARQGMITGTAEISFAAAAPVGPQAPAVGIFSANARCRDRVGADALADCGCLARSRRLPGPRPVAIDIFRCHLRLRDLDAA
jgi:hypothetical protein